MEQKISKNRIRLLADRLCYLAEGQPGLTRRHGMQRAEKTYRDKYDRQAEELAPTLLKPDTPPAEIKKIGWTQLTLV
jgi:hypothetical protein